LNWAIQNRLSLDQEQRKSVLDFYKKYHYWSSLCEDPTCGLGDDESLNAIEQSLQRRLTAYREMDEAYAMFTFFAADATMVGVGWEMIRKTIELQRLGDNHMYAMMPVVLSVSQQLLPPATEEKVKEHAALIDRLDPMSEALVEVTRPIVNEVGSLKVNFINHCRQVLYGLTVVP
jgi:hypothetical protein